MDDEDRRAFDNLILLCLPHAEEIDLRMLVGRYPVETLRQWKIVQLQAAPSDPVVIPEDVLERAVVLSMDFRGATIDLGGKAASAPGAGGSGGGAIGPGARGGDGGHGGNHYVYTFDADQLPDKVEIEFGMPGRGGIDGLPGEAAGHMLSADLPCWRRPQDAFGLPRGAHRGRHDLDPVGCSGQLRRDCRSQLSQQRWLGNLQR